MTAHFSRPAFYTALRPTLGALTQANVVGFEHMLDEALKRETPLDHLAYIGATAWWETGKTMQPVREAYWVKNAEAWRKKNLRYWPFYGRGHVQLTWEDNYRKVGEFYGLDLVGNPDMVLEMELSIRILFDGMTRGWFTGKKLDDYLDGIDEADAEDLREFTNARRIVNGTDKQVEIGKLALAFEAALRKSNWDTPPAAEPLPGMHPALEKLAEAKAAIDAAIALL